MATTSVLTTFDTGHMDMVHDIQFDYYGRRVASCSSDRTIKIFDVAGGQPRQLADLVGHEGPVWAVSWGHPKFGTLLASCSYDHRVIVWKETQEAVWTQVYRSEVHTASVNSVAWAPHELGAVLACASSDGSISIITHLPDGSWHTDKLDGAHSLGCTGISWAPATPKGALVQAQPPSQPTRRFVSAGCDNAVRVWQFNPHTNTWEQEGPALVGHTDWVRDVAWAPSLGLPSSTIASAGQDGKVFIWTEADGQQGWSKLELHDFNAPVWRVSWSLTGNILCVSDGNNSATLWKETVDGMWQQLAS